MPLIFEDLFGNCPVCERKFRGHSAATLAGTPHDGSATQQTLLAAVETRDWDGVVNHRAHGREGFLPLRLFAIRCVTGRLAVVVVSYVDAFVIAPEVFTHVVLDEAESIRLAARITPERWQSFGGRAARTRDGVKMHLRRLLRGGA